MAMQQSNSAMMSTEVALLKSKITRMVESGVPTYVISGVLRSNNVPLELAEMLQDQWNARPWAIDKWLDTVTAVSESQEDFLADQNLDDPSDSIGQSSMARTITANELSGNVRELKLQLQTRALYYRLRLSGVKRETIFAAFGRARLPDHMYLTLEDIGPGAADTESVMSSSEDHNEQDIVMTPSVTSSSVVATDTTKKQVRLQSQRTTPIPSAGPTPSTNTQPSQPPLQQPDQRDACIQQSAHRILSGAGGEERQFRMNEWSAPGKQSAPQHNMSVDSALERIIGASMASQSRIGQLDPTSPIAARTFNPKAMQARAATQGPLHSGAQTRWQPQPHHPSAHPPDHHGHTPRASFEPTNTPLSGRPTPSDTHGDYSQAWGSRPMHMPDGHNHHTPSHSRPHDPVVYSRPNTLTPANNGNHPSNLVIEQNPPNYSHTRDPPLPTNIIQPSPAQRQPSPAREYHMPLQQLEVVSRPLPAHAEPSPPLVPVKSEHTAPTSWMAGDVTTAPQHTASLPGIRDTLVNPPIAASRRVPEMPNLFALQLDTPVMPAWTTS